MRAPTDARGGRTRALVVLAVALASAGLVAVSAAGVAASSEDDGPGGSPATRVDVVPLAP